MKDTETYCLVAKVPKDIALNDSIPEGENQCVMNRKNGTSGKPLAHG